MPHELHSRIKTRHSCWTLKDARGNELFLFSNKSGIVTAINGGRITVQFDDLPAPADVNVFDIVAEDFVEGHAD